MILVVGATGLLGSEICARLRRQGAAVRGLVRRTANPDRVRGLQQAGVELAWGDLKDPESLAAACRGVDAVISTASSTLSRQAGDSIESVDGVGQMSLVNAAKDANVGRFLFVSFRQAPGFSFPLGDAKREVEKAIGSMNFTV